MILFLDFDGVLHPYRCPAGDGFSRLGVLEAWLRDHSDIDVVISSSWRRTHSLDALRGLFSADLRQRIIDTTPIAAHSDWAKREGELLPLRFEREEEVMRWLSTSGASWRPWVAMDDQPWRFKPFNRRLVTCVGELGLRQQDLDQATRILTAQQKPSP